VSAQLPATFELITLPNGAVFIVESDGLIVPRVPRPKVPPCDSGTFIGNAPAEPPF